MPMIIKHIDKIAREKQRDVLYIEFDDEIDYTINPTRKEFLKWLEANEIPYLPCAYIANECVWDSYKGQLYIDIPMDENNAKYRLLNSHLENEDGSFKIEGIKYMYVPLEMAMKNSHHDAPGFWDEWAENF